MRLSFASPQVPGAPTGLPALLQLAVVMADAVDGGGEGDVGEDEVSEDDDGGEEDEEVDESVTGEGGMADDDDDAPLQPEPGAVRDLAGVGYLFTGIAL